MTGRASASPRRWAGWVATRPAVLVARVLPAASGAGTAALAVAVVVNGLFPVAFLLAVGRLAAAVTGDGAVWPAFWTFAAVWLGTQVARSAQTVLTTWLGQRLTAHLTGIVLAAGVRPTGIGHLEDPALADRFHLARGVGAEAVPPGMAVTAFAEVAALRLRAAATAVTLTAVLWWAAVPLAVAWLLAGAALGRGFARQLTGLRQRTEDLRRAAYVRGVAIGLAEAKEVRVFGLGEWLRARYREAWTAGMAELFRRRPAAAVRTAGLVVVLACAYVTVVGTLAAQAVAGTLTVAALTVGVQAAVGMASFGWVSDAQWQLAAAAAALPAATGLRTVAGESAKRQAATRSRPAREETRVSAPDIRFSAVRFGYPGRPAPAVDGLDLRLPAGRTLGVVGDNGAGKSTIVRLLCRLHDPDHGTITADGVDLRHVDPAGWRRRLAVVFQDFVRYELSARDNVVFGQADMSADVSDDELWAVAEAAGAEDVIHALPDGWDTVLSRRFGTTDLSGGQWQRLALARALFAVGRGASVLVLDEPTAHLDAMAEAALYERFLELTEGLTTVLVSHRFNTVRLADRIAVVRGGTVAEYGDHDTLMAVDGWYARSFRLQADRLGATE